MPAINEEITELRIAVAELRQELIALSEKGSENRVLIRQIESTVDELQRIISNFESMGKGIKFLFAIIMTALAFFGSVKALYGKFVSFIF